MGVSDPGGRPGQARLTLTANIVASRDIGFLCILHYRINLGKSKSQGQQEREQTRSQLMKRTAAAKKAGVMREQGLVAPHKPMRVPGQRDTLLEWLDAAFYPFSTGSKQESGQ